MKKRKNKYEGSLSNGNSTELKSEDFDGHTDFRNLTPEQKLTWLSQAVQFYYHKDVVAFRKKYGLTKN